MYDLHQKYNVDSLLRLAIQSSLIAAKEILRVYHNNFTVEFKGDKSPLTEADRRSNDIINQILNTSNIPIISEENKELEYSVRKNWDVCWIVDPLDGTKEFIKKNGEFTVNIALIEMGKPKLGIIYVPVTKELYYADVTGQKAFKSIVDHNGMNSYELFKETDLIKSTEGNKDLIRIVGSRSHMNQDTLDFVDSLKEKHINVDIVSKGSSLKFCLLAEGKADVYPRFAPTMEWDTAAGQAICEASGLKVLDMKTNKPMVYNRENMLNNYFLVTR